MRPRPLSPHLQVYRLPLTGLISISHRLTGMALVLVFVLMAPCLSVLPEGFESIQSWLNRWPVKILLGLVAFAFSLHLVHGIRHLVWDTGKGFAKARLNHLAMLELAFSLLLTVFLIVDFS